MAGAACGIAPAAIAQSGVDVDIEQFGVGMFRPGGIVPMRVKLTSNLAEPTPVWVQWQVANADGDVGEYGRSLTLSPGQTALTWLYAPIQPNDNSSTVWTIRVFEERDGERRGEIGGRRFAPTDAQAQMADLQSGMIAVIGDRRMSLDDYSALSNFRIPRPLAGHEDLRIASGIKPAQLPDRWYGLMAFDALAWSGDNTPPQDLSIDQADAIREYVQRGGHLIISLPSAGNPWGLGALGQTQLEDLLPCRVNGVVPRRDEAVPLGAFLPVMSKTQNVTRFIGNKKEPEFGIRVFKDLKAGEGGLNVIDNGFEPLLALADGRVIAVQKVVGFGRVTVIGIDLADGRLASLGLPQADVFWNRILGRRVDTPTLNELQDAEKAEVLARPNDNDRNMGSGMLFSSGINMQTTAGVGLLLALLLFIAYWVVALGSFFVLRFYKRSEHAWVAFAAIAAIFTFFAWGSVGVIPKSMDMQHVTVLDHIARPPNATTSEEQFQRATSFFSLYLPRYGRTNVSVASLPDHRDILECWTPPGESIAPFPNTDVFRVDVARSFATVLLPSRSTTTQLKVNWMGGVDSKWGGLLRVDPSNPVRVIKNASGGEQSLAGTIISELPGVLQDPVIIWVRSNRIGNRRYLRETVNNSVVERTWIARADTGIMANSGEVYGIDSTTEWGSGVAIDLAKYAGKGSPLSTTITQRFVSPYENNTVYASSDSQTVGPAEQRRLMLMMSMFHQLDPPEYLRSRNETGMDSVNATFHRDLGRELDLSAWFTRPCVIVMGFLPDTSSPIPLRVAGSDESPDSVGLTMVRWIYPLPLDEEVAFRLNAAEDEQ